MLQPRARGGTTVLVCVPCGAEFAYTSAAKRHVLVHTRERPFPCRHHDCTAAFTSRANLQRHVTSVHDELRWFACPDCDQTFKRDDNLQRHVKRHSISASSWACTETGCSTSCLSNAKLQLHRHNKHARHEGGDIRTFFSTMGRE